MQTNDIAARVLTDVQAVLNTDPGVGVHITDTDGRVLLSNRKSVSIYLHSNACPTQVMGVHMDQLFPSAFVDERVELSEEVTRSQTPQVLRSIRRGRAIQSTLYPLTDEQADAMGSAPSKARKLLWVVVEGHHDPFDHRVGVVCSRYSDLGPFNVLTRREFEVLTYFATGMSRSGIAAALFRSVKTVDKHVESILNKLGFRSRGEMAVAAARAGFRLWHAGLKRTDEPTGDLLCRAG